LRFGTPEEEDKTGGERVLECSREVVAVIFGFAFLRLGGFVGDKIKERGDENRKILLSRVFSGINPGKDVDTTETGKKRGDAAV
jgi:hypothetical protein